MRYQALTGLSLGSMKKILMMISNSPQPVSVISYGGFVTTGRRRKINSGTLLKRQTRHLSQFLLIHFLFLKAYSPLSGLP